MARRIVFYTHAFDGGGAELVFARLSRAFAAAGDSVLFVADHGRVAENGEPPSAPGVRYVALPAGHLRSTLRLRSILRAERADASFSALGAQNLKHLAAAILAGRRRACVLGYHGFARSEPKRLSRLSFALSPITTRLAAATICVSDALLADVRGRWRASRTRTRRIYNPVVPPSCDVATSDVGTPDVAPLVLACGRLVEAKRFVDLVAAFAEVEPLDARLAILGEGPDRPAIEAVVAALGIGDRVVLPGHVADTSAWYRRAACVAIASESESFGLTVAEALAHGVPVASTDCGGPREILADGRYGTLVPIGDTPAMTLALTNAIAAPGDPAPRRRRAQEFSLGTIHARYAALADSLRRPR